MVDTWYEFRIDEDLAKRYLPADVGRRGNLVRRVKVRADDPVYTLIGELERKLGVFFSSWRAHRRYTAAELNAAEILTWFVRYQFEPTGEECGTDYDWSTACPYCRTGRTQRSELVLDLAKVPNKDVAISIGGEIVVSERFAEVVRTAEITGFGLLPVRDARRRIRKVPPPRLQLVVESPPVPIASPPTAFGLNPFDLDPEGQFRCPLGHVAGLNLLSEISIPRDSRPETDLVATREHVGDPGGIGLLVPEPRYLISRRFCRLLQTERLTGSLVQVAHLTP